MRASLNTFNAGRLLAVVGLLILITLITALATLLSSGAAFLSVWLIALLFGFVGMILLATMPAPSLAIGRIGYGVLLVFSLFTVVWPRYATFRIPGLPALSPTRISLLLLLVLGFYLISKSEVVRQRLFDRIAQFRIIFVTLALLLLIKLLGAVFSEFPFLSLRGVLNEVVSVYLPMLVALAVIESRRDVHRLLATLVVAAILVTLLALYEYRLGTNIFVGRLEIDSEYLAEVLRDKVRAGGYRLQSTFAHPLTLSEYLVLLTPVAVYLAFVDGLRWTRLLLLPVLLGVMAFVIVKTGSRSGIGSFAVALGACTVALAAHRSAASRNSVASALYVLGAIVFVFVAAAGLYLLMDTLVGRTTREFNSGVARLQMWHDGLGKAAIQPLFGYGQDMAAHVLGFVGSHGVITIDSFYLSVLLDGGFVALLLYLFLLFALAVIALRSGLDRRNPDLLSALLLATILSFMLIKAVVSLHHNHVVFMILMAAMLSGLAIRRTAGQAGSVAGMASSRGRR